LQRGGEIDREAERKRDVRERWKDERVFISIFRVLLASPVQFIFRLFYFWRFLFFLQKRRGPREGQEPVLQVLHSEIVFFPLSW
jgi:hypothetical protein